MINYGVIVGRFQVNSLHPGHLELFRQVTEKHDRVIVFIGIPRTVPTKRNPLDFETRKKMIQAEYPDFIILPLRDEKTDQYWSDELDEAISSITNFTGHITLYGGRDSFVPHYFGLHPVTQLNIPSPITGTEIREKLSNRVMQSADFRAGAIYAASNQFNRVLATVDVAILHDTGSNKPKLLLGRKPGEELFRFPGGFVNIDETLEAAAHREAYEETNLDISSLQYLGSFPINDWRYSQDIDTGILTSFFVGWSITQGGKAGDDIEQIKWYNWNELPAVVEAAHMPLFETIKKYVNGRFGQ